MEQKFEKISREIQDSFKRILREYAEALILAIVLALLMRHFVLASYKVTSASMAPVLQPGDYILGFKPPYGVRLPFSDEKVGTVRAKRGDISIIRCDTERNGPLCIKRVLGLPGDRLEIAKGHLIRNGEIVAALGFPSSLNLVQVVPPHMFFLTSDQFGQSASHFEWGLVSEERFVARGLIIWFSRSSAEGKGIFGRIGQIIR